jgi:hypothetical protein
VKCEESLKTHFKEFKESDFAVLLKTWGELVLDFSDEKLIALKLAREAYSGVIFDYENERDALILRDIKKANVGTLIKPLIKN